MPDGAEDQFSLDAKMAYSFPVDPQPKTAPGVAAGKRWIDHESMASFMEGVHKQQKGPDAGLSDLSEVP